MSRTLLLVALLSACGVPGSLETLPAAVTPGPYDTAAGVLSHLGEPCHVRALLDGTEAWDCCGRACPFPDFSRACVVPCTEGCARGWSFYLLSGVVTHYEAWGAD
jgi:hypothetical protein